MSGHHRTDPKALEGSLFPWERLISADSNKVRSGLATAGGKEAPTARTLKWSAKDVSVDGQKEFELGLPIIMSDDATIRFAFTTLGLVY